MNWLWKLEKQISKYAIKNLMYYIVALNGLAFVLYMLFGSEFIARLYLVPGAVFSGEIWRLFTFIFIPPSFSLIWIIFALYFYYMIGSSLEHEWGEAKFNLYYLFGVIGTIAASFLTNSYGTATYLNLSLFLAFAHLFPDYQVMLFLMIPVKMKYLAYLNWAFFAYTIIIGPMSARIFAIVSLINFFIFFFRDFTGGVRHKKQVMDTRKNYNDQIREFKRRNK